MPLLPAGSGSLELEERAAVRGGDWDAAQARGCGKGHAQGGPAPGCGRKEGAVIPPTTLRPDDSGTYELIAFDVRVPGAIRRTSSCSPLTMPCSSSALAEPPKTPRGGGRFEAEGPRAVGVLAFRGAGRQAHQSTLLAGRSTWYPRSLRRREDPGTFAEARERGYDGFVFTASDPFCGVDLDRCTDPGEIEPWAAEILDELNSYTELSPALRVSGPARPRPGDVARGRQPSTPCATPSPPSGWSPMSLSRSCKRSSATPG